MLSNTCGTHLCRNYKLLLVRVNLLSMQLLLDTTIRKMLRNKSSANMSNGSTAEQADLTDREKNAVRYMAGYIAVTLLKRYKKHSNNDKVRLKGGSL